MRRFAGRASSSCFFEGAFLRGAAAMPRPTAVFIDGGSWAAMLRDEFSAIITDPATGQPRGSTQSGLREACGLHANGRELLRAYYTNVISDPFVGSVARRHNPLTRARNVGEARRTMLHAALRRQVEQPGRLWSVRLAPPRPAQRKSSPFLVASRPRQRSPEHEAVSHLPRCQPSKRPLRLRSRRSCGSLRLERSTVPDYVG